MRNYADAIEHAALKRGGDRGGATKAPDAVPKSYAAGLEMSRPGGACLKLGSEIPSGQEPNSLRANGV